MCAGPRLPTPLSGSAIENMGRNSRTPDIEELLSPEGGEDRTSELVSELTASAEPAEPAADPKSGVRGHGLLVEFVRLIIVALFAVFGWEIAFAMSPSSGRHLVGIVLGSAVGYVLGGVLGRRTEWAARRMERELRHVPAAELLAGGFGLILGLVLATLLSLPLFRLPGQAAYPAVAFIYVVMAYVWFKLGASKSDELFAMFGVKPRAAGTRPGEVSVLDSSAILDGRVLALIHMGFLSGSLLVTRSVLAELQAVADSSNSSRRARGRRALDMLVTLHRDPAVDVVIVEGEGVPAGEAVDVQLVRLAKARGGTLVTNDGNLAKVAAALDVPVRSIHALAEALRPEVVAGDRIKVPLTRRGRDHGQGVGYLEDGTMVVVEDADHLLGDTVSATVTNALQTSTGRLIFARVAGDLDV
jgi:uncharacterized protein YacL